MTIVPASTFTPAQLAQLLNDGYEGYFVPIQFDEATFLRMVDAMDIDLDRSRAIEGEGIALLGVRGDLGWIGGLGVVPSRRRAGVGRALMEAVLADAPDEVWLEVIEQNEPAIRLYEQLGFRHARTLEVWRLEVDVPEVEARVVASSPLGQDGLPWQRADASLSPDRYVRIEVDGAAALIAEDGGRVGILQLRADDVAAARAVLAAARSRGEHVRYLNVPESDVASVALRELGGSLDVRQFELRR